MGVWWDFRVIKRMVSGRQIFEMYRVFYKEPQKLNAIFIEDTPATVIGFDALSMAQDIELLCNALDAPTIYIPKWNTS